MTNLILKSGPHLIKRDWEHNSELSTGKWHDRDVTANAHQYLFDTVQVDESVTLQDIFGLLEAAPLLQKVFRRDFCVELLVEAKKGISDRFSLEYSPEGIEYLELYQILNFNTDTREYLPMHRLQLHGQGYVLKAPWDDGSGCTCPAGERIQWGVSLAPLRELLPLPLKVRYSTPVCEDDTHAKGYGCELDRVSLTGVSLSQVLHGILWELSFHGGPVEQESIVSSLKEQMDQLDSGTAETVSTEEFFESRYTTGFERMFESTGHHKKSEVRFALRQLEDDCPVQEGLVEALDASVRVRPEFALLPARTFRKEFSK